MTHPMFDDYSVTDPNTAMHGMTETVSAYEPTMKALFVNTYDEVRVLLRERSLQNAKISDPLMQMLPPEQYELHRPIKEFLALWPLFSHGDHHADLKEGLRPAFTNAALEPVLDSARTRCAELVEEARAAGAVEWVGGFAYPFARHLIAALFGVPEPRLRPAVAAAEGIVQYMAKPLSLTDDDLALTTRKALDALRSEIHGTVLATGRGPAAEALRAIEASPDLGPESAVAAAAQILTGSLDPLASLLTDAVRHWSRAEEQRDHDADALTEETLRLGCPFRFVQRHVSAPLTVDGHELRRGDRILLGLGPGNLDPRQFSDPLAFRPGDDRLAHLSFGFGPHYCPGAALARGSITALFDELRRTGAVVRTDETELRRSPYLSVGKVLALPVTFR
ncbi:cytochrome P450 [Streptomyces sp. NPDC007162]|uniref:cytochrome P450 n=1 Tax=Streptomyces sp. NPDC007162 TaxID=3156917 RepID=UPI0033F70EFE